MRIEGKSKWEAAAQTEGHCSPLITARLGQATVIALRETNVSRSPNEVCANKGVSDKSKVKKMEQKEKAKNRAETKEWG